MQLVKFIEFVGKICYNNKILRKGSGLLDKKRIVNIIGKILMVLSIVFIAVKIYRYNLDFSVLSEKNILIVIALSAIACGFSTYFLSPFGFVRILGVVSPKKIPARKIRYTYCKSNLYKYLPGNVMHYVGRNQIAVDEGIAHSEVITASVLEVITIVITSCILSLVLSYSYFIQWFETNGFSWKILVIAAVAVVLATVLAVVFRKKAAEFISQHKSLLSKKMAGEILISAFVYTVNFLVTAFVSAYLIVIITGTDYSALPKLCGLSVMAWLIGFITPGAPGGIGIRESVMCMFLATNDTTSTSGILTAVLLYRIVCILGDVIAFLIGVVGEKAGGGNGQN